MWFIVNKQNPPKFYSGQGVLVEVEGVGWVNKQSSSEGVRTCSQYFIGGNQQALKALANSEAQGFPLKKDAKQLGLTLRNGTWRYLQISD